METNDMKNKYFNRLMKDKRGGYTDIFLFIILAVIIVFVSVIFVYMGNQFETKLHEKLDNKSTNVTNFTKLIDENIGAVNSAYGALYWISIFLILGMIVAIFIGSY